MMVMMCDGDDDVPKGIVYVQCSFMYIQRAHTHTRASSR